MARLLLFSSMSTLSGFANSADSPRNARDPEEPSLLLAGKAAANPRRRSRRVLRKTRNSGIRVRMIGEPTPIVRRTDQSTICRRSVSYRTLCQLRGETTCAHDDSVCPNNLDPISLSQWPPIMSEAYSFALSVVTGQGHVV